MGVRRKNVDNNQEDLVLTGLIVSSELLKKTYQFINVKWFKTKYAQKIAKWCIDYYSAHREAPKQHIEYIFKLNEDKLDEDVAELISNYLEKLSDNFTKENFNDDYVVDVAMNYFRIRSAGILVEQIQGAIVEGKSGGEINTLLAKHKDIAIKVSEFVDVKEVGVIKDVLDNYMMENEEDRKDYLFSLSGNLGKYVGPIDRSSFYAFIGSMKKGKSFLLQEIATQAVLSGLNVVLFNFEMNERKYMERIYKRFLCKDKKDVVGKFPVFDCEHNLRNDCPLGKRNFASNNIFDMSIRDAFEDYKSTHAVCTECRGKRNFKPSSWFKEEDIPAISVKDINKINKMFAYSHGELMLKCYPMGTANVGKIKDDLIQLEYERNFLADILIIDYADILAPEYKRQDKLEEVNETWQWMKSLAEEKHIAVFTATQTNRQGINKNSVEETDTSENIKKLAHVDFMYTVNQNTEEKIRGIVRVGTIASRWEHFDKSTQCLLLHNLSLGQIVLDSEIIHVN